MTRFSSRRNNKFKLFGLKKTHYNYYNQEKIDYDYLHKLSKPEKDYLAQFSKEFYEGKKFETNFIENKKECYNRKNAAERDVMARHRKVDDVENQPLLTHNPKILKSFCLVRNEAELWAVASLELEDGRLKSVELTNFDLLVMALTKVEQFLQEQAETLKK